MEPDSFDKTLGKWDLFISHASEDKIDFVQPLAESLAQFGVQVWYDKFTLKMGDSLSRSIDEGLSRSNFGLVVLSPSFIEKRWTEYELRGLIARELSGGKVILPIWHNISLNEILAFSPPLADKLAVNAKGRRIIEVALEVIKVIRPDILTRIARRIAYFRSLEGAKIEQTPLKEIKFSPVQHPTLPPELIGRIRLIRASLLSAYENSMDSWLEGFRRDAHPSREVAYWEHFCAVYCEYIHQHPELSSNDKSKVFSIILAIGNSTDEDYIRTRSESLPNGAVEILKVLWESTVPVYDLSDLAPPFGGDFAKANSGIRELDKEHFPHDIPDALIRQIMEGAK